MKIIKPAYYRDFQCIAGACPDSCCQGWEVDADEASLQYYQTLDDALPIKQRIMSVLAKDEFDNTIFTLAPQKRCPFLNSENLCDMHIAIGGEHTPITCRQFPRFIYDFGGTREMGISFSCPVAAKLIYHHPESLTLDEELTQELPALNDIDAMLYMKLRAARQKAYAIMQNQTQSIAERLRALLSFACDLQKELGAYNEGDKPYTWQEIFTNPELINPEWQQRVAALTVKPVEDMLVNEQIAIYYLYKYFLQALEDNDVLSKVKMAVVGVLINTFMESNDWTMHLWSKETEHSQYNMDRYKKLLREADCLSVENLMQCL